MPSPGQRSPSTWSPPGLRRLRPATRARVIDAALAASVFVIAVNIRSDAPGAVVTPLPAIVVIATSCLALVARRRRPLAVWAATLGLAILGVWISQGPPQAVLPFFVAQFTVASWRGRRTSLAAAVAGSAAVVATTFPLAGERFQSDALYPLLLAMGLATATGVAVADRREVVRAATERAERAERSREETARRRVTQERLRIARELHDVVAHHISVINVQAGVARHLAATDPAAAGSALDHVRQSAGVVIAELSTMLGLLREEEEPPLRPAPGMGGLDGLIESVRRAGTDLTVRVVGNADGLPPGVDLTAYRLLQEALTNAAKHGTGSADVVIEREGDVLALTVTNPVAHGRASRGEGYGLVGMRERVGALGGSLEASAASGTYTLRARLPVRPVVIRARA